MVGCRALVVVSWLAIVEYLPIAIGKLQIVYFLTSFFPYEICYNPPAKYVISQLVNPLANGSLFVQYSTRVNPFTNNAK